MLPQTADASLSRPVQSAAQLGQNFKPCRIPSQGFESLLALLDLRDVLRLEAFRPLLDLEFNQLAFGQRFVSVHLNRGEMNEHIFARLSLDEAVTLRCVKPLHHTLFSSQRCCSSALDLPNGRLLPKRSGCESGRPARLPPGLQALSAAGILAQTEITVHHLQHLRWRRSRQEHAA